MPATTRRGLLGGVAAALVGVALAPRAALGARALAPSLQRLSVRNLGRRYAGDRELFATVAPGSEGRGTVAVAFRLRRRATVRLEAVRTALRSSAVAWQQEAVLGAGAHRLTWTPTAGTPVGSYVMRLTIGESGRARKVLGGRRPLSADRQRAPVVRVLGVEAAFARRSYSPGEPMALTIFADAPALTLTFLHCGAEAVSTDRGDEMTGVPMGDPARLDWTGKRSGPVTITVQGGEGWASGLYAARLQADDGRVGFAPFVLRPKTLGATRQAVVLPTNTWQAYNLYDRDGDGWGDTWYAGGSPAVDLTRPYRDRGVPPRYKRYDLGYLKWLRWTDRTPDMLADDDLEAFASGDDLRRLYDLVVFPGHSEYVSEHAYDVVERFRDLGGRLIFLSANNFFWKVEKQGDLMRRVKLWRDLGRPEARLCGVQYRANDDGGRQGPFSVVAAEAAPWLFEGTGLANGSTLGDTVGGYGIEIDMTTADSPPGTKVLALIPSLFGPGLNAEMTYYETAAGARVFSAGALDFGGSATFWPVRRMLDNLWLHMLEDVPRAPA